MDRLPDWLTDISSKIKDIYVEIHNYSYHHKPTDLGEDDARFIGRADIMARLKRILTHNETKSGAYLVTGYRGMGKSSFVHKVLNDIKGGQGKNDRRGRYFRIFIMTVFLVLLVSAADCDKWNAAAILFSILAFGFSVTFCLLWWYETSNLRPGGWRKMKESLYNVIKDHFHVCNQNVPFRRARYLLIDMHLAFVTSCTVQLSYLIVHYSESNVVIGGLLTLGVAALLFAFLTIRQRKPDGATAERSDRASTKENTVSTTPLQHRGHRIFSWLLLAFYIAALLIIICFHENGESTLALKGSLVFVTVCWLVLYNWFCSSFATKYLDIGSSDHSNPMSWISGLYHGFRRKFTEWWNYLGRLHIRVNLSYDELREIDILRLIARNIQYSYKNLRGMKLAKFFGLGLLIYLVTGTFYYLKPIYNLNEQLKRDWSILNFVPSQSSAMLSLADSSFTASAQHFALMDSTASLFGIARFSDANTIIKLTESANKHQFDSLQAPGDAASYEFLYLLEKDTWQAGIRKSMIKFDFALYSMYKLFRRHVPLPFNKLAQSDHNIVNSYLPGAIFHDNFRIIPLSLDYLLFFYCILAWYGLKMIARIRPFGLITHSYIERQLAELNNMIEAQVTLEETAGATSQSSMLSLNFGAKRAKQYRVANERDIERRLLQILDDVDAMPKFVRRAEFIFVFDELDKIEPHSNITLQDKEQEQRERQGNTLYSAEWARERQQKILHLLSNLKHFLTTAKAKFIFIAGRDLYDASLADVSDRNFFIGSIFHDVIYVPSFLSDDSDGRYSDATSMTEWYICQYLLPDGNTLQADKCNFTEYDKYLARTLGEKEASGRRKTELKKQRELILRTLQSFITYLTYRSNGAPKKLTANFENYITRSLPENDGMSLIVGSKKNSLYLRFRFNEQYIFNMITYLYNPFLFSINKSIKHLGDKLLVSSSFLVDHLYKFHKFAFSWRNLELTPEIVDINKAPELRNFIGRVMEILSRMHIQHIVYGLYHFKFSMKISEELSYLSKVSERESAAFNFTLDESLMLKRHYRARLKEIHDRAEPYGDDFNHSKSFLNMILGDLHFYDEEYNEAIEEYMEAVHPLRSRPVAELSVNNFVLLVRNMLKLGLAFERRKTFDTAFLLYSELASKVVAYRDIDLNKLGLTHVMIAVEDLKHHWGRHEVKRIEDRIDSGQIAFVERDSSKYVFALVVAKNYHQDSGGAATSEQARDNFQPEPYQQSRHGNILEIAEDSSKVLAGHPYSPEKDDLLYKISTFEGIRLIIQPFIAKLQMTEKINLGGITEDDLIRLEAEYRFVSKALNHEQKYLMAAEFRNKVGDVLYYKNSSIRPRATPKEKRHPVYCQRTRKLCTKPKEERHPVYCQRTRKLCTINPMHDAIANSKTMATPCDACEKYMDSIAIMYTRFIQPELKGNTEQLYRENNNILLAIINRLANRSIRSLDENALKTIASTLSAIGDVFVSCGTWRNSRGNNLLTFDFLNDFLVLFGESDKRAGLRRFLARYKHSTPDSTEPNKLEEALIAYFLSASFYQLAGNNKSYAAEYFKILALLREYLILARGMEHRNGGFFEFGDYSLSTYKTWEQRKDHAKVLFGESFKDLLSRPMWQNVQHWPDVRATLKVSIVRILESNAAKIQNHSYRSELLDIAKDRVKTKYTQLDSDHQFIGEMIRDVLRVVETLKYEREIDTVLCSPVFINHLRHNNLKKILTTLRSRFCDIVKNSDLCQDMLSKFQTLANVPQAVAYALLRDISHVIFSRIVIVRDVRLKRVLDRPWLMERLQQSLVKRVIRGYYRSFENSNRLEIEKLKNMTESDDNLYRLVIDENMPLHNLSIGSDIGEVVNVYNDIKALNGDIVEAKSVQNYSSPYSSVSSMFSRVEMLISKAEWNNIIYNELKANAPSSKEHHICDYENAILNSRDTCNSVQEFFDDEVKTRRLDDDDYSLKKSDRRDLVEALTGTLERLGNGHEDFCNLIRGKELETFVGKTLEKYRSFRFSEPDLDRIANLAFREIQNSLDNVALQSLLTAIENAFHEVTNGMIVDETFVFTISDSIYCLHEVLKNHKLYGMSYMMNHAKIARVQKYMGRWCRRYAEYLKVFQLSNRHLLRYDIARIVERLIGQSDLQFLAAGFHTEEAIRHYYEAIETHVGGKAYSQFIGKMHYLNDDFHDRHYHFYAAIERFHINSGKIEAELRELRTIMGSSKLYDVAWY